MIVTPKKKVEYVKGPIRVSRKMNSENKERTLLISYFTSHVFSEKIYYSYIISNVSEWDEKR